MTQQQQQQQQPETGRNSNMQKKPGLSEQTERKPFIIQQRKPIIIKENGQEFYLQENDERWHSYTNMEGAKRDPTHEVVIDKRPYALLFNQTRKIMLGITFTIVFFTMF